ncbi:hypothetical protein ACIRLA_08010 [Streptomyces sp. NPDC102364]|uniref:hypothetical protein n=1 Tax=Streptomyces sp. NPDC102364 TaxID=3366161 RepID=UPI0038286781
MSKYSETFLWAAEGCIKKADGTQDCSQGAKTVLKTIKDTGPDLQPVAGLLPLYQIIAGVLLGTALLVIFGGAIVTVTRGGFAAGFKKDGGALKKSAITVGGLLLLALGVLFLGPALTTALGG